MPFSRPIIAAPLAASLALLTAGFLSASISDRWPTVAFDEADQCELTIKANRIAMEISAQGFIPGETLVVTVTNGDMKPIRLTRRAADDGSLQQFYSPFRSNRQGGLVGVSIEAARCSLSASAPWTSAAPTIP